MRSTGSPPSPSFARINVTPIIDVALVLVITLLVTAPILTASDVEVTLPTARSRGSEHETRLSITMGPQGQIAVDEDVIPRGSLETILRSRLAELDQKDFLVVIRADAGLPYRDVSDVIRDARSAGATRLAFATMQSDARRP